MITNKPDITTCQDIKPYEDTPIVSIIKELKKDIKKLQSSADK
jgi:hypothetical protein